MTGLALVPWQLRIAAGQPPTIEQRDVQWRGWAMECRVYAEDPDTGFLPSPGRMTEFSRPSGPGIRLDSGVYSGWTVPMEYDPLLAKLATWAETRDASIDRLRRALDEYSIAGIRTNVAFFQDILLDAEFRAGNLHTGFIDEFFARRPQAQPDATTEAVLAALGACETARRQTSTANGASRRPAAASAWKQAGFERLHR